MPSLYVRVAVENSAFSFDRLFTYRVPDEFANTINPGVRVMVPFGNGNRERIAVVFSFDDTQNADVKSIISVLDDEPVLSEDMLELAKWMQNRYYCTYFDAVKLMLPAGMNLRVKNSYVLKSGFKDFDRESYTDIQWNVITLLHRAAKSVLFEKISNTLGISENCPDFAELLDKGIIQKVSVASGKMKSATSKMVRPILGYAGKLTASQQEVYQVLSDIGEASEKELCYFTGVSPNVLKTLEKKGALERFEFEVYRRPDFSYETASSFEPPTLSQEQNKVLSELIRQYSSGGSALLYGVTGSGKTSVFLKFIEYVLSLGRDVIVMVPEISLTAQTISIFRKMFGDKIAVFHSGLSLGERMDEWKRVKRGEASIVVGTRSAIFAPVRNLGLVVIDEEQEHTYRSESAPRYDAREVSNFRCRKSSAFCLLCSATPSLDTYRQAQEKKIFFHKLENRFGNAKLPRVELIDMNEEGFDADTKEIGPTLLNAIKDNYEQGNQSIILLNRRGYNTFISCRSCRTVVTCPHCSISLNYHSANKRMMCHYCGYSVPYTRICPSCKSESLVFRGSGTQKAEEQLQTAFPDMRVLRIDTDSVTAKFSLERKLESFANGEYDIIVGTQMVAKGLDFKNVTLVGVISADQFLYNDDFRSNERTFDLLTQVVGRAGRGDSGGTAMIQTYIPENPVLELASKQDYHSFYEQEILYRQMLLYPPFVDILVIGFVGENELKVKKGADFFLNLLSETAGQDYPELPLRVLRPAPAAVAKMNGKYRYKIIIKHRNGLVFRKMISQLLRDFTKQSDFRDVTAYADPNPYMIM